MTVSQSRKAERPALRSPETVILFSTGGSKFAIAAHAVDEIRDLAGLKRFTSATAHPKLATVKHILDRQGQCYFVVDGCAHFHLRPAQPSRLLILRDASVAVMVDAIDCMYELNAIHELPQAFSGEERNWYRGLTLVKGKVVPLVRPEAFLSKAETALLFASKRASEAISGVAVTA